MVTLKALGAMFGGRLAGWSFASRMQEVGGATITVCPPDASERKKKEKK